MDSNDLELFVDWDSPQKILVILAHPDDPEFFCGASIAYWCARGHEVKYCLLTRGDKGVNGRVIPPQTLKKMREEEQRAAAAVLGVKQVSFLDYPDGYLVPTLEARRDVVRVIRRERPDIIVTCDPLNYFPAPNRINHPDHRAAGQIVMDAVFPAAGNPMFFPELLTEEGLEPHEVREVWFSLTRQPNVRLDVTPYWDQKIEALRAHHSQIQDFNELEGRMRARLAPGSTPGQPRYEEYFYRIVW